ncbi:TLL2 [Branchiostoma lanceolatum]|uniref:TLL2 protein n=1 Tax=Branchiostoma lanceolatum TaxID=7740 RepID=A0A8J9Z8G0_BRALA|nr:TLL2 [Branchiostoma lanceolatum]
MKKRDAQHYEGDMSLFAILLALVAFLIDGASSVCSNGGSFSTFSSQGFTTDNYPAAYPNDACEWSVTVPAGSVVLLGFSAFDVGTKFAGNCFDDYIDIFDGDSTGTLLGRYCEATIPPDLLSSSNTMTVKLTTSVFASGTHTGFSATFTASASGLGSGCNNIGTFNGETTGSFATMNYGTGNYDNSATCTWEITVSAGMYVTLSFASFDVDNFVCNGNDKVTVYSGVGTGLSDLGSYCGTNAGFGSYPPSTLASCTNEMTVVFTSDSATANTGFLATFSETASGSTCPATTTVATTTTPAPTTTTLPPTTPITYSTSCTGTGSVMTSTTGTLETMNYPNSYDSYANCTWEIQVAAVSSVSLSFDNFRVGDPNDTSCTADYVAVYDGISPNAVLLGTYCTWTTPPNVTVSSGELTVIFISDGVDNTQGFSATYTVTCIDYGASNDCPANYNYYTYHSSTYYNHSTDHSTTDYNSSSNHGCTNHHSPDNHGYTLYPCCNNNDCCNHHSCTHYNNRPNYCTTYNRSPNYCAAYNRSPNHCATYYNSTDYCTTFHCSPYNYTSDNVGTYDFTTFDGCHDFCTTVYSTTFYSAPYNFTTVDSCPNYYTAINASPDYYTSVDSTSYDYIAFHRCSYNHPAFDNGRHDSTGLNGRSYYNRATFNSGPNHHACFNGTPYNYTTFNSSANYTASYNCSSDHCTAYDDT